MEPSITSREHELRNVVVHTICNNKFRQNCFLIASKQSDKAVVIDPGYGYVDIKNAIKTLSLVPKTILATHAHFDHIASVSSLQSEFGSPEFLYHEADRSILRSVPIYTHLLHAEKIQLPENCGHLRDGDSFILDSTRINVLHAPGHTPGGCIFEVDGAVFTGDLLIGRPERQNKLPGLDLEKLRASQEEVLQKFEPQTTVFPGHGKITSIVELRRFLLDTSVAEPE